MSMAVRMGREMAYKSTSYGKSPRRPDLVISVGLRDVGLVDSSVDEEIADGIDSGGGARVSSLRDGRAIGAFRCAFLI